MPTIKVAITTAAIAALVVVLMRKFAPSIGF